MIVSKILRHDNAIFYGMLELDLPINRSGTLDHLRIPELIL